MSLFRCPLRRPQAGHKADGRERESSSILAAAPNRPDSKCRGLPKTPLPSCRERWSVAHAMCGILCIAKWFFISIRFFFCWHPIVVIIDEGIVVRLGKFDRQHPGNRGQKMACRALPIHEMHAPIPRPKPEKGLGPGKKKRKKMKEQPTASGDDKILQVCYALGMRISEEKKLRLARPVAVRLHLQPTCLWCGVCWLWAVEMKRTVSELGP